MKRSPAALSAALASVALLATACSGTGVSQSGPLIFGLHEYGEPENRMCSPRSYLENGYYLGEIPSNPTGHDIVLISLTMVDPDGVEPVGTGVVDNTGNTMSLSGGRRDLEEAWADEPDGQKVRWPEIGTGNLDYILKPGEEAQVMMEVRADRESGAASVGRLEIEYESEGRTYREQSNLSYYFSTDESGACPPD